MMGVVTESGCHPSMRLAKLPAFTTLETIMIKLGKLGVAMLLCAVVLAGCNTVAGAGKDVQKVGEKVEEAAK